LAERTEAKVTMASTRVPPAVASAEMVAQSTPRVYGQEVGTDP
jgi:hypothetical protein